MSFKYVAMTTNPFAGIDVGNRAAPTFTDLDGDGDLDLVVGETNGTLLAYERIGAGFSAFATNPLAGIDVGSSSKPAFTDLDGDGDPDLAIGESGGTIIAYQRNGASFNLFATNPFAGIDVGFQAAPAFTDLDGDGDLDLVSGRAAADTTLLSYERTASGFSLFAANPLAGRTFVSYSSPAVGDLDGDGDLDLVVGHSTIGKPDRLAALEKTAAGYQSFTSDPFAGISSANLLARPSPALVDLDGDGKLELVVGVSDGTLKAYRYNAAPAITSSAAASFAENGTGTVFTATASDAEGDTLTWSISGGADAGLFDINANTGAVTFKAAPNFEAPGDAGADNVYDITVTVSDGVETVSQSVAITVTDVAENTAPVVTSAASANFAENGTGTVFTATASDAEGDTLTWSISGGADAGLFDINANTGAVTFKAAPNFEAPGDANQDNRYEITLDASDGSLSASQTVVIAVADVAIEVLTGTAAGEMLQGDAGADSISGLAGHDTLIGGDGNDTLRGGIGNDSLLGQAGNDVLDGRTGNDTMIGGTGDDRYIVNSLGDVLVELAGEGDDEVLSSITWTLASHFEDLYLTGTAAINGTGNDLANFMHGNAAGNRMAGGGGNDSLHGDGGADTLLGGAGNDLVDGEEGDDRLEGGTGNDHLIGDAGADVLLGDAGNDTLDGGAGRDVLTGGAGRDIFIFGSLADSALGNPDVITDFTRGADRVHVKGIDPLAAAGDQAFVFIGGAAFAGGGVAQARIYTQAGNSFAAFDVGDGGAAEMVIQFTGVLTLTASDFIL